MSNKIKKSSSSVAVAPGVKREQVHEGDLNCLELRLGISSDDGCSSPWGVDPWSLAARQEKASLEQAHQRPDGQCDLQRETRPEPPVGWPPVRAFRKNQLSTTTKPAAEEAKKQNGGSMLFVKVNMEGCAVGRKVDLRAHRGYASLSRALQAMFSQAFLHDADDEDDEHEVETNLKKKTYILLYEDNEGDRMLVGDVPWELFVASVKRLYITQDPRTRATS